MNFLLMIIDMFGPKESFATNVTLILSDMLSPKMSVQFMLADSLPSTLLALEILLTNVMLSSFVNFQVFSPEKAFVTDLTFELFDTIMCGLLVLDHFLFLIGHIFTGVTTMHDHFVTNDNVKFQSKV